MNADFAEAMCADGMVCEFVSDHSSGHDEVRLKFNSLGRVACVRVDDVHDSDFLPCNWLCGACKESLEN